MAGGPVIITDDGGPPLKDVSRAENVTYRMRVGRLSEAMSELTKPNTGHAVLYARVISHVEISQAGEPLLVAYAPASVTIADSAGKYTVFLEKMDNGVNIQSNLALDDVSTVEKDGWYKYETPEDTSLGDVKIDNISVKFSRSKRRVAIYFL